MVDKIAEKDIVLENESLRSESTQSFTGVKRKAIISKPICNEVLETNPKESFKIEIIGRTRQGFRWLKNYTLGTWNVRTMNCAKVDIVKSEMERIEVNLGIKTFFWK